MVSRRWDVKMVLSMFAQYDRHNGKAYSLTGPEALSYREAAEILSKEVRMVSPSIRLLSYRLTLYWWNCLYHQVQYEFYGVLLL